MSGRTSIHQTSLRPIALNFEGATAPEWVELIPAGADVTGRDGRTWTNPDPQAVVTASDPAARPLPMDWEHATEVRAPQGLEAPAAAWIEELQVRDGAIWGRPDWTPKAAGQVANREYRYLSPVFTFDKTTCRIVRLVSVGLTNTPNLHLTALNREEALNRESSETTLDLAKLRTALGLPADATDEAIINAATTAKAANSQVDLTRYAPREELTTALNRAVTAETSLKARDTADREAKITAALDDAQAKGKITPASRPEYLAMCKADGGLESFERLAATLPTIAGAAATGTEQKVDKGGVKTPSDLTDEQRAVCRALGQDEATFAKSLSEKAA